MKFLSIILAAVLVPLVFALSISLTIRSTVFRASYVESKLKEADVYKSVSGVFAEIANEDAAENPQDKEKVQDILATVFSPEYIEKKVHEFLPQLENHYTLGADLPVLDLRDAAEAMQSKGWEINPNAAFVQKVSIPADVDAQVKDAYAKYELGATAGLWTAIVLLLLLVLANMRMRSYGGVTFVFLMNTILLLLMTLALWIAPKKVWELVHIDPELKSIIAIFEKLSLVVANDLSMRFGWLTAGFAAVTVLAFSIAVISKHRRNDPAPAAKPATPTPTVAAV